MSHRNPYFNVSFFLTLCLLSSISFAQTTMRYTVYSDAKPIGNMSVGYNTLDTGSYTLEEISHIKSPSSWEDKDLQSHLLETHQEDGSLIKSDKKVKVNDKIYWTKTELFDDEFLVSTADLTNDQQKEDDEVVMFAKGVVSGLVPGLSDVMMVGELLLSEGSNQPINNRFAKDSIDTSFLNLPYLWKNSGYRLPKTLCILDMEKMIVFSTAITYLGEEILEMNGAIVNTKHYKLSVENNFPTEIWLAAEGQSSPYFFQITGKDDGDVYKIVLSSPKLEK